MLVIGAQFEGGVSMYKYYATFFIILFFISSSSFAEMDCEYTVNPIRKQLVSEKIFIGYDGQSFSGALAEAREECFDDGFLGCEEEERWFHGWPGGFNVSVKGQKYQDTALSGEEIKRETCHKLQLCQQRYLNDDRYSIDDLWKLDFVISSNGCRKP